ncbi:hypothetical protein SDC9_148847 [bioreactor metagenome]|uniref:Uncharacterized protein n=1 Tax=bioreactor metagenome TaxID=1076179 RepID=A0A645EIQ8_9ZZZZ
MPFIDDQTDYQYNLEYAYWNTEDISNMQRSSYRLFNDLHSPACLFTWNLSKT